MSYWVYLRHKDGTIAEVPDHSEGGTIAISGDSTAALNVTYNYTRIYRDMCDFSLRNLHGEQAIDWIVRLWDMTILLTTYQTFNYWEATCGNAGHALNILLGWARLHPRAIFEVS